MNINQQLLPIGVPGEIHIAGAGVACGYLNKPLLTAERFIENPFVAGKRMYRSGDLGRWFQDGNIEFLGRIDNQVKIRGYRIELGEIEKQLLEHEEIKEAVVTIHEEVYNGTSIKSAEKNLCAYIVGVNGYEKMPGIKNLKGFLSQRLPDYMIPTFFVPITRLPLAPSGKADVKALPKPGITYNKEYIAPRNQLEQSLVETWSNVLKIEKEKIGIDDNFFDLGGHSLKATLLMTRIHKKMNIEIPLSKLFSSPTIRGLALYMLKAEKSRHSPIEPAEEKEYYVLSSAQKRLYFLQQMDKAAAAYNTPSQWTLEGTVDKNRLEDTFRKLIQRHESLRTSLKMVGEEPVQLVHDDVEFEIEYYQVEVEVKVEEGEQTTEERRQRTDDRGQTTENRPGTYLSSEFIRPFDLSQAPLLRVGLVELEEKYLLMVDMHHVISDGVSTEFLVRDFMALYSNQELPKMRLQYKDYAQWQNREKESERIQKQAQYWKKKFQSEIPVLDLPADYPRPAVQSFEGRAIGFEIGEEETAGLNRLTSEEGASLYIVLLSLYTIFLSKVTGQEDMVVGTPVAGRSHADLQQIIGMFVNTLGIRNYPVGKKTCKTFLREVKDNVLETFENRDYPFEELVENVEVNRDAGRSPLFDVMFILQNIDRTEIEIPGLKLLPHPYENRTSKFDLTLQAVESENRLQFTFEYCTKLFKAETIERFINYFRKIATSVLKSTEQEIWEIDIIPASEKGLLLEEFNDTAAEYPGDKTLHEFFAEQVKRTPDGVAVICMEHGVWSMDRAAAERRAPCATRCAITYRELNEKSTQFGHILRAKGTQPDTIVGIMLERSIEMIVGIIAILKAGGAYLPIEPN